MTTMTATGASAAPGNAAARRPSEQRPRHKLRLTRRGRVVVLFLLTALILLAFALGRFAGSPADASTPAAQRTVVVEPGQSLWAIAKAADPHADTRQVAHAIADLNGLDGATVVAGQELLLPS